MQTPVTDPGLVPDLAPGLMRLASRLAGSSDAEDLVQSTWVRALEHHGLVRDRRPWLRRVMRNEQQMQLRGRKRREQREHTQRDLGEAPADVDELVHCLEVAQIVHGLLEELDDDLQLVVRERYFQGSSAAEIARRHRIPAGTVRWRLKSGLDRLRTQLDARYGGRRALWAGGFAPASLGSTLSPSAASQSSTAGETLTAAGKGLSTMSLKILLATSLVATAGGVAWIASAEPEPTSVTTADAANLAPIAAPSVTAMATSDRSERSESRARWAKRRSAIQAAQATGTPKPLPAPAEANPQPTAEGEGDQSYLNRLTPEVIGLLNGCREFMEGIDPSVTLNAHVIGAPDVGMIVESVELSSHDGASEELLECLTESMYDLELGAVEHSVDHEMTMMLGGSSMDLTLEDIDLGTLDPRTRAAITEALARAKSNNGMVSVVLGDESGAHDEQTRDAITEALTHGEVSLMVGDGSKALTEVELDEQTRNAIKEALAGGHHGEIQVLRLAEDGEPRPTQTE